MHSVNALTKKLNLSSPWAGYAAIAAAVVLAYASVWPNEFVFDDMALLVKNELLKQWSHLPQLLTSTNFSGGAAEGAGFYRPVPMFLHFLVYQMFGLSTVAFHALNIGLQALNGCLLYRFGLRAGFRRGAAFAAALLWAVHPLFTEAVAYMSSTPELLGGCFLLLGLTTLTPEFSTRNMLRAAPFFLLALGSLEATAVFPALAAVTFFWCSPERKNARSYLKLWPLWLAALLYIAVWFFLIHANGNSMAGATVVDGAEDPRFPAYFTSMANRILTSLAALPVYAGLIVWPQGLHMERLFPVSTTLLDPRVAAGLLAVILSLVSILRGRGAWWLGLSFGLLWFGLAHAPTTGILVPINGLIAEHWMYLPLMGLLLGVAEALAAALPENMKRAASAAVALAAIALGIATFQQGKAWQNQETLYATIKKNGGNLYRISVHAAEYNMRRGEFDKALEEYSYQAATPFGRPAKWMTGVNIMIAMANLRVPLSGEKGLIPDDVFTKALAAHEDRIPAAIAALGQALQTTPGFYWAHKYLALIYRHQGNKAMAAFHEKKMKEAVR